MVIAFGHERPKAGLYGLQVLTFNSGRMLIGVMNDVIIVVIHSNQLNSL